MIDAPYDDNIALWYYPEINRFTDDDGNVLNDLSDLFYTWQLDDIRKTGQYTVIMTKTQLPCEVYFPEGWRYRSYEDYSTNRGIGNRGGPF